MDLPTTKQVTAEGLLNDPVFATNITHVKVKAPDWSGSKAVRLYVSESKDYLQAVPFVQPNGDGQVVDISFLKDGLMTIEFPGLWVFPHITNVGTGASVTFIDAYGRSLR